jgi:uncharacterized protein YkwD
VRLRRSLVALLTSAVLVAGATAGAQEASAYVPPPPVSSAEATIGYALFTLLNQERAANRLPALRSNPYLRSSARYHDVKMAGANQMAHQVYGEPSLGARVSASRYNWAAVGENIAWNSDMTTNGAAYVQKAMYNEKAPNNLHRVNMLSRTFRDVGVDVYLDRVHHKMWITFDFGVWR